MNENKNKSFVNHGKLIFSIICPFYTMTKYIALTLLLKEIHPTIKLNQLPSPLHKNGKAFSGKAEG
jgi:uncharacterized membrane protein